METTKKIVITFSIMYIVCCCKTHSKDYFDEITVNKLAEGWGQFIPPRNAEFVLFGKSDNNKYYKIRWDNLYLMYKLDYSKKYNTFELFCFDILNQRLTLNQKYLKTYHEMNFELNLEVVNNYNRFSFKKFVHFYTEQAYSKRITIKKIFLDKSQLDTIMYFFYINDYIISNDDYVGKIFMIKRKPVTPVRRSVQ